MFPARNYLAVSAVALSVIEASAAVLAQSKYQPRVVPDGFGQRVVCLDDADVDGIADFAIAAPNEDGRRGAIYAVSGATWKQIYAVHGLDGITNLGFTMQGGGDVDGDGVLDLLVSRTHGAWKDEPAVNVVKILSGRDGRCIRTNRAADGEQWSWSSARILGDLQSDCCAEYAIGTSSTDRSEHALVVVFDGKSGNELVRIPVEAPREADVRSVAWFRDPAWHDELQLAIGMWRSVAPIRPVEIRIARTGALRSVIHTLVPHEGRFSGNVHTIGDVDGDGVRDLVMTSTRCSSHPVADVEVVSARTGKRVWARQLAEFPETRDDSITLGAECVAPCADIDGDRVPDVLASNHSAGGGCGMVWAMSGATGQRIYAIHGEMAESFGISIAVSDRLDELVHNAPASAQRAPRTQRVLVVGCKPTWIIQAPVGVDERSHVSIHSLIDGRFLARLCTDDLREAR